jgi:ectoine hydrolase
MNMNFTKVEYKARLKKVQSLMQEKGIELLISSDTANMNYLTGYDAWSFYYAQAVVVHANAEEPLCWIRKQDSGGAYIKTYLKNNNILVYDEKYIHTWPLHPYDNLVDVIKERKWDKLSIGLEMDSHYFTAYCYEKLKQGLPDAKFKDSERLINWARVVKSNAEIELMKSAAIISQKGMQTAIDVINPGVRQCDAVGEIQKALFYGTAEFGGEYSSIATLLPTGKGTSASHLTATQDKFVEGEATIIELSGVYQRYHVPMARTVLLGKPDQKKIDTMNKTNEALQAGIDAAKPGKTADDVAQAFWKILDKYGIEKTSRTGYSIGIGYPPDWGEHTLNISKGDMTILEANVTFHMIAVMQFGDWGVEASESVRVTDNGHELFCNFSRNLHIK